MASFLDKLGLGHYSEWVKELLTKKADLESPVLTGTPEAPTPEDDAPETQIATVGYVSEHGGKVVYETVEGADVDEYTEYGRYHFIDSSNLPTEDEYFVDVDVNGYIRQKAVSIPIIVIKGYLKLSVVDPDNNYIVGAKVNIYSDEECTTKATNTITTEDDDVTVRIAIGTYYVKVTEVPEDYKLNETVYTVEVTEDETTELSIELKLVDGYLTLFATDTEGLTVSGVVFGIYSDEACTQSVVDPVTTEDSPITVALDVGTYYVKQTSVPTGFVLDEEVKTVEIASKSTVEITVELTYDVEAKSGTVVINGDVTTDLDVDGNVEVTGDISGNVNASGTITYGTCSGSVKRGATLDGCDFSIENGTLTFASGISLSLDNDGVLYTTGTITNGENTNTTIDSDLIVKVDSSNVIYNSDGANLTVTGNLTVELSTTDGYYVYNTDSATFTLSGSGTLTYDSDEVKFYLDNGGDASLTGVSL